ncbi:maleylpyruvate isomerase N-terminal domain-containing protein [Cellulomonas fengjieae]|uniref:Maleylpyruvate isomerase N-terminal domain-containing protein n=1 Tax=Cellulomonas fengjieae TaxID=2819978 RepID=A0ABS3SKG1_9CELL|nr:maleylpyruvate isomerase N-terminal domain-containing protein [Cellulomonas fengjieae]MBO3085446.1 maleylpyruvate isomerase N-terminal domain-containing protein [Cellulomonas fengjieae]MBO3101191.1 maleylpyruvate isomerase N-terminal domain-containing protein [Cellulomonas fengjieae]QVI66005.1 maleylpyruvate isomerase N-terminal domain-containing protein [Cellulomonas fengjieae]
MKPVATIDACHTSHRVLLERLASLTEEDLRAPSLLPGYSRGHVVAHVVNKAKAHALLFDGAVAGEVRRIHPDGYDPDRAAELGAARPGVELRTELAQCFGLLETAWAGLDDALWTRRGHMAAGPRTMAEIVGHHLRNVEVHHVDLDIGHRPSDWPSVFVDGELPKRLRALPDRADRAELLAWLLDRAPAPELSGPW